MKSFTLIDLFCGAGGLSEGFHQAGWKTLAAVDFDEMAATTFRYNHSFTPFFQERIESLKSSTIRNKSDAKKGNVTAVCGGPPCQGFSLAGQRLATDPRNTLFKEFVRVVKDFEPKVFVFENVAGIKSIQSGKVLDAIIKEFSDIGYICTYRILNAVNYGLPQARPRFILIGRPDSRPLTFPDPTHDAKNGDRNLLFEEHILKPPLNCWDALSDLPKVRQGQGAEEMAHSGSYLNPFQKDRKGYRFPGVIFNHRATRHSSIITERYAAIPEGGNNSQVPERLRTKKINVFKLDRNKPARTITCNFRTDILHPVYPRGTTVREAARLQSFDDDYRFFGNLTRKAKWVTQDDQVGNAVPPLLAKCIAEHISKAL